MLLFFQYLEKKECLVSVSGSIQYSEFEKKEINF